MISKNTKPEIPDAIWTIKDVLLVILCIYASGALFYFSIFVLFGDNKTTFTLARYVGSLLMIIFPILWVKKNFRVSKRVLGLRKGSLSFSSHIFLGVVTAIIYLLLVEVTPLRYGITGIDLKNSYALFHLILLPLSPSGFATIVLTPVAEEILIRGYIYGYLRKKLGVIFGVLLQGLLFSLLHFDFVLTPFARAIIIGFILGYLYEKTGSLYPSMICHGMINYFSMAVSSGGT